MGFIFFLATTCQNKTSKIGITFFSYFELKLCILQDKGLFENTYPTQLNSHRKLPQTASFIFLSNSAFQDEANKIWFTPFGYS